MENQATLAMMPSPSKDYLPKLNLQESLTSSATTTDSDSTVIITPTTNSDATKVSTNETESSIEKSSSESRNKPFREEYPTWIGSVNSTMNVHLNMDVRFLTNLRKNIKNKMTISEEYQDPNRGNTERRKPTLKSPSQIQCCSAHTISPFSSELTTLQRHLNRMSPITGATKEQETPTRLAKIPSNDTEMETYLSNKREPDQNESSAKKLIHRNDDDNKVYIKSCLLSSKYKEDGSNLETNNYNVLHKYGADDVNYNSKRRTSANIRLTHDLFKKSSSCNNRNKSILKNSDEEPTKNQNHTDNVKDNKVECNRAAKEYLNNKNNDYTLYKKDYEIPTKNCVKCPRKRNKLSQKLTEQMFNEITVWLNESQGKIHSDVKKDDVRNILLERLEACIIQREKSDISIKTLRIILMKQIYNMLNKLPVFLSCSKNKTIELYQLAENLANRLLCIDLLDNHQGTVKFTSTMNCNISLYKKSSSASPNLSGTILVYPLNSSRSGPSRPRALSLPSNRRQPKGIHGPPSLGSSTPRKRRVSHVDALADLDISEIHIPHHVVERLSPEEKLYTAQVKEVIDQWYDMVFWLSGIPTNVDKDVNFKATMVEDLANTLVDVAKYKQLKGDWPKKEEIKEYKYRIHQWIRKIEPDNEKVKEMTRLYLQLLVEKVRKIIQPNLTKSQYGTRKDMIEFDHPSGEWGFHFTGQEVLEDAISIWLNDQPSDILNVDNKDLRDVLVHDLANQIRKNVPQEPGAVIPDEITEQEVKKWLYEVVKPDKTPHLNRLTKDLKHIVKEIPTKRLKLRRQSNAYKFIQEQVIDCAIDWLREREFYKASTPQEQHQQERVLRVMADDYWKFENSAESTGPNRYQAFTELYTKAKEDQFNKLPTHGGKKMTDLFDESTIYAMFQVLYRQMGEVVALRTPDVPAVEIPHILAEQVDTWVSGIRFKVPKYTEKAFDNFKKVFMYTLVQLISKNVSPTVIKGNIEKFLKKSPLDESLKTDPQFLHTEIEVLYAMLEQNCQGLETVPVSKSETYKIFEEEVVKWALDLLEEQEFHKLSSTESKQEQDKFIRHIAKELHEFETSPDAYSPIRQKIQEERYINFLEQLKRLPFDSDSRLGDNFTYDTLQTFLVMLDKRITTMEDLYFNDAIPIAEGSLHHTEQFNLWLLGMPIRVPNYLEKLWGMFTKRFVGLITETIDEGLSGFELKALIGKFLKEIPTLDRNLRDDDEYLLEQLNKFYNELVARNNLEESIHSDVAPPVGNVLPPSLYENLEWRIHSYVAPPVDNVHPPSLHEHREASFHAPYTWAGSKSLHLDQSLKGPNQSFHGPKSWPRSRNQNHSLREFSPQSHPHVWSGSKSLSWSHSPRKASLGGPRSLPRYAQARPASPLPIPRATAPHQKPIWSRKDVEDFFLMEVAICAEEWLSEQEFFHGSTNEEQIQQHETLIRMAKDYHLLESAAGDDRDRDMSILLHGATDQFKLLPVQSGLRMMDVYDEATIDHIVISSFYKRLSDIERFYIFDLPVMDASDFIMEIFELWLQDIPLQIEPHCRNVFNFYVRVTNSILTEFLSSNQSKENVIYVIEGFLLNAPIDESLRDVQFMSNQTEKLYNMLTGGGQGRMYGVSSLPTPGGSPRRQGRKSFGGFGIHTHPHDHHHEPHSWIQPSYVPDSWGWSVEARTPLDLFFEEQVIESVIDWVRGQEFYTVSSHEEHVALERVFTELAIQYHAIEISQTEDRDHAIDVLIKEAQEQFKITSIEHGNLVADIFNERSVENIFDIVLRRMNEIELLYSEYSPQIELSPYVAEQFNIWMQDIPVKEEKHIRKALHYYKDTFLAMLSDSVAGESSLNYIQDLIQTFLLAIPIDQTLKQDDDWLYHNIDRLYHMVTGTGHAHGHVHTSPRRIVRSKSMISLGPGRTSWGGPKTWTGFKTQSFREGDYVDSLANEYVKQFDFADHETKDTMINKLKLEFQKFNHETCKVVLEKLRHGEKLSVPIPIEQFQRELVVINAIIEWFKHSHTGHDTTHHPKKHLLISDMTGGLYYLI